MNYRFEGKHRTLALGVSPGVALAQARELLRRGVDPSQVKTSAPKSLRFVLRRAPAKI